MKKPSEVPRNSSLSVHFISSPFGKIAAVWHVHEKRPKIFRVVLSLPESSAFERVYFSFPEVTDGSCREIDEVSDRIEAFLSGQGKEFSLDAVRMDLCSDFQKKVLIAEHGIPRGHVSSYQRLAARVGMPNGARAVGNCLASNPFPLIVPCHRVIRSDGALGGYQGGAAMKRELLRMEGVSVSGDGNVVGCRFFF